jgi:hypothetical protein
VRGVAARHRGAPRCGPRGTHGGLRRGVAAAVEERGLIQQRRADSAVAPVEQHQPAVVAAHVAGVELAVHQRVGQPHAATVHRDHLDPVSPGRLAGGQPLPERLRGAAGDHVQQPRRPGAVVDRREVDDHGDGLVAAAGVPPAVLIHADHGDAVEPVGVVDEHPRALGQDRTVGGAPRHRETLGHPGDGQVLACLPAPTAGPDATASPEVRLPGWCPGATRARTPSSDTGAPRPPASSAASPAARAPTDASPSPAVHPRSRTGGTTGPGRRHGRPAPRGRAPAAARRSPGRARPGRRTWSGQGERRSRQARRGLP